MKAIESWIFRIADSDVTWFGFSWLRPAKHERIGFSYIMFSSILYGLPGVAVGAGLIYLFLGRVDPQAWLSLFLLVLFVELPLNSLFAHFWNRRASMLAGNVPAA